MKSRLILCAVLALVTIPLQGLAEVEWQVSQTLNTGEAPVDTAVSGNGRYIFVLTDSGAVKIYSPEGDLKELIDVGEGFDGIQAGRDENLIYLKSSRDKTVKIVSLEFIQNIDTSQAPFKGPADATVTMVVFSDFQ